MTAEPAGNPNVPENEVTAQMQAMLRMFQSRPTHTCPAAAPRWDTGTSS